MYAPCGHKIFMTRRYPLNNSDVHDCFILLGTYAACGNTYKTNTTWSRDIDPLSPRTVRPWDVRFLPYLEWATLPGEMFTLVVYDPGYLVTHAIYNNIRGHDISTADVRQLIPCLYAFPPDRHICKLLSIK